MFFAVLAFMFHKAGKMHRNAILCNAVNIEVTDSTVNSFISAKDVKHYLDLEYGKYIGCAIDSVDLDKIENILKTKTAVLKSDAFVTKDGVLNITIRQRKPVVRFIGKDKSFYADADGETFPIQKTYASYVHIVDGVIPSEKDSSYIKKIVRLVNHLESGIWKNKIVQIRLDSASNLTLFPREGQERFIFGQPIDIEGKTDRMELYYKNIIPEKGSKRYNTVDVRYNNQIICK